MGETFKGLPPLFRGIIAIVIVAIVVFILYKVYKAIQKKLENRTNAAVVSDAQEQLNNSTIPASFSDSTYQGAANTIAKLLDGCELQGSEMSVIREIIKTVKNSTDWYKLIVAFGNRDVSDCGSFGYSKSNYDLISLLKDQLDSLQAPYYINEDGYKDSGIGADTINILSKYLASKGITI